MKRKNATRSALFTSVISLLLCVSMLVGTTFAWFTDSVESGRNVIAAGNLDVELYHGKTNNPTEKVDNSDKLFTDFEGKLIELWEPGVVAYTNLKVANVGTLALKYQMALNFSNATAVEHEGETYTLADVLKVAVVEGGFTGDRAAAHALDYAYTLSSFELQDELKGNETTETYGIVVYWEPGSDDYDNIFNLNNGRTNTEGGKTLSIDLGVNLFATQVEHEEDSFDINYDKDTAIFVSTADELKAAINEVQNNGTICLNDGTYNISGQLTIPGKSLNIVGIGENVVINMTDERTNHNKIFYIYGSAEGEDITVNISNVTLTAPVATKSDIWIRTDTSSGAKVSGDVTVNLDNVVCTSVICDNNYVDGDTINLNIYDSTITKLTPDASPMNNNGLNTYTNVTYKNSRIDHINIQGGVASALDHITINGVNPTATGEQQPLTYVDTIEELQAALNSDAANIVLCADMAGDVTAIQKADVKIEIEGNGHTFAGVIVVDGKSGTYTTAGLTIKNVNFKADSISADACIRLGDGNNATRYTCNVTVENCTFDVPGAVGVKSYTGGDKNLTITGCTATANAHSLVQAKGIDGILVENCKVYSKNGLNFNNSTNVTVSGCTADVTGYAVRFGESKGGTGAAETYAIKNSTLKSACDDGDAVIILRGTADYSTLTISNTTLTGGIQIANTATDAKVFIDGAFYAADTNELNTAISSGKSEIVLGAGEFNADLYLCNGNRNLTIVGQGADTVLNFVEGQVRLVEFDSLTIENCTIGKMVDKAWGQVVFGGSTENGVYTFSNCVFNGMSTQGVYINPDNASTYNFENCTFNGDFGSEGAISIQNNDGKAITVNVTDCAFTNIPGTSHSIFVHYAYDGWTLNAEGVEAYWKAKQ